MLIESYLLEQFDAVARCGTLLKASEELHISQPSLSRSMKKLEDVLGVSLFIRENSKISLNETGKLAADYARRVLEANQDLIDRVAAYDRSLHTVSIGSCSPFPINDLMPILQEYLSEKTLLTELAETDRKLLTGLKNRQYDLVILHSLPEDKNLYCQRYMDEQIYLTVDEHHPLAQQKTVSFAQLQDLSVLISGKIGFWMDICRKHLPEENLLVQRSTEALGELISASNLPFFNSNRMIEQGYQPPCRISIPISDEDAHATYWAVCRASDKNKYISVFNAVRSNAIRNSQHSRP